MDVPDLKPRQALRRALSPVAAPGDRESRPAGLFAGPISRGLAPVAALVSRFVLYVTSDLTRTGVGRFVAHATILAIAAGVVTLGATAANAARAAESRTVLAQTSIATEEAYLDIPMPAAGGSLFYQQADIVRQADPYTIIPDRPRKGVIEYTVQPGDVLFTIAARFNVTPETILWANEETLDNDPHQILPGTVLVIPPVSGVLHTVQEGDTLESIAEEYKVSVDAIVIDGAMWNNFLEGRLPPVGSTLIVPGGQREFKGWELPKAVVRTGATGANAPALGQCVGVSGGGLIGSGTLMWPNNNHWVSGYNYSAWHPALDLAGRLGDPVYAADSGWVVYAGWSNVGYGNLIVIDHGNGWQTWYAHLSQINVTCGQNVWQGSTIAAIGSTGNSSGPHLHLETRFQGQLPNPFNVLPPP